MAKFSPPWASVGGVARSPTVDEQNDGFSCGSADLTLFNRKFQGYDAELAAILDEGGITGTEEDDTGVLQAIQALIAAATGGGDTSQFVLFSQAQARLPIFPEVTTNNSVIAVTDLGTGNIRIPASATILHRGIRTYTTVQTDIATTLSKTYHLRWNPTDGFSLKDLADTGYNPTVAAETNAAFDSTYDDMLVARIVTNSSNVPTITPLVNRDRLNSSGLTNAPGPFTIGGGDQSVTTTFDVATLNWARAPKFIGLNAVVGANSTSSIGGLDGVANHITSQSVDRYKVSITILSDFIGSTSGHYANARWSFAA